MALTREQVIENIRVAFKDVVLGRGIGLIEGRAIDDYEGRNTRRAFRERDEKMDWEAIPVERLNKYYSSLSFFDAEGMRFHLPAFMKADIMEEASNGMIIFHLTHLDDSKKEKFALLSSAQRAAVCDYLRFIQESDEEFDWPEIGQALKTFWEVDK
jgi:hypothetical protein